MTTFQKMTSTFWTWLCLGECIGY